MLLNKVFVSYGESIGSFSQKNGTKHFAFQSFIFFTEPYNKPGQTTFSFDLYTQNIQIVTYFF